MRIVFRKVVGVVAKMLVMAGCSSSTSTQPATQNCVAAAPTTQGSPVIGTRCFGTFEEAIAYATDNTVQLPDADASRYVARQELAAANNLGSVVISIDYKDANYSGASFTWTATTSCGAYTAASMP